jgi:hypothetical protein
MCRSRAVLATPVMVSAAAVVSRHAASTGTRNSWMQGGHAIPVVQVDDARRRGCETGDLQESRRLAVRDLRSYLGGCPCRGVQCLPACAPVGGSGVIWGRRERVWVGVGVRP